MSQSKIPGCVGHLQSIRRPDLLRMVQKLKAEKHLKTIEKKRKPKVSFLQKPVTRNELCMAINMRRKEISARKFLLLLGPLLVALLFGGVKVWKALKNPAVLADLEMKTLSLANRSQQGDKLVEKAKKMPIVAARNKDDIADAQFINRKFDTVGNKLASAEFHVDDAEEKIEKEKETKKELQKAQKELDKQMKKELEKAQKELDKQMKKANKRRLNSLLKETEQLKAEQKTADLKQKNAEKVRDDWLKREGQLRAKHRHIYDSVTQTLRFPSVSQSRGKLSTVRSGDYIAGGSYANKSQSATVKQYGNLGFLPTSKSKRNQTSHSSIYSSAKKSSGSEGYVPVGTFKTTPNVSPYGSLFLAPNSKLDPTPRPKSKQRSSSQYVGLPIGPSQTAPKSNSDKTPAQKSKQGSLPKKRVVDMLKPLRDMSPQQLEGIRKKSEGKK
jgi:hypothetical protein